MRVICVLLLIFCCWCVLSESEDIFSSSHESRKFIILQIGNHGLPERLQYIANWYVKSLISSRVLIVSWLLTKTCNVSLSSIFNEYPPNMKLVMEQPFPDERGDAYIESISKEKGFSYIKLDEALRSSSDLARSRSEIEMGLLVDSPTNIVYTTDSLSILNLAEPCLYRNAILSEFYSQLTVNKDILTRANRIFQYFNDNMLIGVNIETQNGILSLKSHDGFSIFFRLIKHLWQYFSYIIENDVVDTAVISERTISKDELQRFLGENVALEDNTAGYVLKHVQSEQVKEVNCWVRFLITADRRDVVTQFVSQLSALPEWNPPQPQKTYTLVYMSKDAQGRTLIIQKQVRVLTKVINPLTILSEEDSADSFNENEPVSSPEKEIARMVEWVLLSRSSLIVASAGSVFAKAVALSQGLAPSAYPLHSQQTTTTTTTAILAADNTPLSSADSSSEEVASWMKRPATLRFTPILHVFPGQNFTFFEDINQPLCGDYVSHVSHLHVPCHPQSVPWDIEPAEFNMHCLKESDV